MTTQGKSEPLTLNGGCQCGAVRYTARPETNEAYYCHCIMCRRAFGNIAATFFNLPKAAVTWEGEPSRYASSKIAERGFCARCGTPLSFSYNDSKNMDISVGSLDEPDRMKPVMHVGVESRLAHFSIDPDLPTKRVDEFEHIVKRWKAAYGPDATPGNPTTK